MHTLLLLSLPSFPRDFFPFVFTFIIIPHPPNTLYPLTGRLEFLIYINITYYEHFLGYFLVLGKYPKFLSLNRGGNDGFYKKNQKKNLSGQIQPILLAQVRPTGSSENHIKAFLAMSIFSN